MTSLRSVLIPSDDFDFVANFSEGYRKLGFDVSAGRINFELELLVNTALSTFCGPKSLPAGARQQPNTPMRCLRDLIGGRSTRRSSSRFVIFTPTGITKIQTFIDCIMVFMIERT